MIYMYRAVYILCSLDRSKTSSSSLHVNAVSEIQLP